MVNRCKEMTLKWLCSVTPLKPSSPIGYPAVPYQEGKGRQKIIPQKNAEKKWTDQV
jgi:hypothetical protein